MRTFSEDPLLANSFISSSISPRISEIMFHFGFSSISWALSVLDLLGAVASREEKTRSLAVMKSVSAESRNTQPVELLMALSPVRRAEIYMEIVLITVYCVLC